MNTLTKWILIASMVIGMSMALPGSAFATNGHQDHQGACARSTSSIAKGVSDLKYNGVLSEFANAVGIHGFDGSLVKQMDEQLVIGKIAKAVDTENTGCDGAGGIFDAGIRHLYKGEEVALKAPAKLGKEVCRHPSAKCKPIRITVHVVFPLSCWNKNHEVTIEVLIWVHKHKHHRHHKHHKHHHHKHHKHPCGCNTPPSEPPPPPPSGDCNGDNVNNGTGSAGNCNVCTGVNVCNSKPPCNCEPPPCECAEPPPPTIKNVYKIQEVRTNEEIQFYADVYAPAGDEVVLTFETEYGRFVPEKFVIASYGAKSHFVTKYVAPSESLMDEICVTALDKTTGKEAVPQCQVFEVQPVSEPPS